jgi:hypothetical protein
MRGDSFTPLKIGFDIFCQGVAKDVNGLPFTCNIDDISDKHRKHQTDLVSLFNHCRTNDFGKNEYPDITGYNFIEHNNKLWIIDFEHAHIRDTFVDKFIHGRNTWNPRFK